MRKITHESVKAFLNNEPFAKSNMQVIADTHETWLCLHGNVIAKIKHTEQGRKLYISNCGWATNTTKERLNGLPNVHIYQKNFVWYLNGYYWDGNETEVKGFED